MMLFKHKQHIDPFRYTEPDLEVFSSSQVNSVPLPDQYAAYIFIYCELSKYELLAWDYRYRPARAYGS